MWEERESTKCETLRISCFDPNIIKYIKGLSQNQDWFSALLNDEATKKRVLGVIKREVYDKLRESED